MLCQLWCWLGPLLLLAVVVRCTAARHDPFLRQVTGRVLNLHIALLVPTILGLGFVAAGWNLPAFVGWLLVGWRQNPDRRPRPGIGRTPVEAVHTLRRRSSHSAPGLPALESSGGSRIVGLLLNGPFWAVRISLSRWSGSCGDGLTTLRRPRRSRRR